MTEPRQITCKRCGYTAGGHFFQHRVRRARGTQFAEHLCLMCRQETQDRLKEEDRIPAKARDILYSHCQRYNRRNGTRLTPNQFAIKFVWSVKQIAHDIAHAHENWCPYCQGAYKGMEHGLADVTLDIINPEDPPYYINTKFCCATCNRRKGEMGATAFGEFLAEAKKRQEWLNSKDGTLGKPQYRMGLGHEA